MPKSKDHAVMFQVTLEDLAQRLGSSVCVAKTLPALDEAKNHLLAFMGDPAVNAD